MTYAFQDGWGTWIRTKIRSFKGSGPTIRRSPNILKTLSFITQILLKNYDIIIFMKKPFLHALVATLYIVVIVLVIQVMSSVLQNEKETIIIPMTMLGLFVLSAAVMGFLFLSEPLQLLMENKKKEAVAFFGKVVGIFACFVGIFIILLLLNLTPFVQ